MKKVRVGLAGLGYFGAIDFEVLTALANVEVAAACEIDSKRLEEFPLPASVSRYRDVAQMLRGSELDVLDVVTAEEAHYEVVRAGLESALDVIVEKPFVQRSEHARELIEAARRSGRHLYVGQILRFDPRYRVVHENLRARRQAIRHL
jgi:predicted dehydrogenase